MTVLINTKLDGYAFLGEPASPDNDSLEAGCALSNSPFFTLIEAMAQLASLHFRRTIDVKRQTFLLKVKNVSPWVEGAALCGTYSLRACLKAKSSATGLYRVTASRAGGSPCVSGEFYISSVGREEFEGPADR